MFSTQPEKCLGLMDLIQDFWNVCSQNVFHECYSWLNIGQFPASLNMTNISLIPKGSKQKLMKD